MAGAGTISIVKAVVLNDPAVAEMDSLTASFPAAPGMPAGPSFAASPFKAFAPSCPIPGYSSRNAGAIKLSGPGNLSVVSTPSGSSGTIAYQPASSGCVAGGNFTLSSAGGPDLGPFQIAFSVPDPGIRITSNFPKGMHFGSFMPFSVEWTGGQPGTFVTVRLIEQKLEGQNTQSLTVPATAGSIFFPFQLAGPSLIISSNMEIDVEVGPDPTQPPTFTAGGLTLGGQATWTYRYRFVGLSMP